MTLVCRSGCRPHENVRLTRPRFGTNLEVQFQQPYYCLHIHIICWLHHAWPTKNSSSTAVVL